MQPTSANFNTRMSLVTRPKIAAELEWRQLTDGADENVSHSADNEESISRLEQLTNGTTQLTRYASLETGRWPLDGTMLIMPDDDPVPGQIGALGDSLADEDGAFSNNLKLIDTWPAPISSAGLTIYFDTAIGEYATAFIIRIYNGATLLQTVNAAATSALYVFQGNLDNYDKLEIEITEWSVPGQKARIAQLKYGLVWVKDNFTLVDTLTIHRQISPVNAENESSEIRFAFEDLAGNFNFMNDAGDSEYITGRQKVYSKIGFLDELINTGNYYMSEWSSEDGRFVGRALDALSLCDIAFPDTTYTSQTLTTIAAAALTTAGIENCSLDSALDSITVSCEVVSMTCRAVLSAIATAACLTLYVSLDGEVIIGALPSAASDYTITYANAKKPVGTLDPPLKKITVGYGAEGLEVSNTYEAAGREVSVTGNPFITTEARASAVLAWLEDYYLRRKVYRSDWRGNPALEAGDIVGVQNDFATPEAQIESTQLTYARGGLSGQIYSRGVD